MSVPKKRKNMKEFNKKEAIGDLLDAFTEVCIGLDDSRRLKLAQCRGVSVSAATFLKMSYIF